MMKKLACILIALAFLLAGCAEAPGTGGTGTKGSENTEAFFNPGEEGIFAFYGGSSFGEMKYTCMIIKPAEIVTWEDDKYPDISDSDYTVSVYRSAPYTSAKFSKLCEAIEALGFYSLPTEINSKDLTDGYSQYVAVSLSGGDMVCVGGYMATSENSDFEKVYRTVFSAVGEINTWDYFPEGQSTLTATLDGSNIGLFLDYNAPNINKNTIKYPFEYIYKQGYRPLTVNTEKDMPMLRFTLTHNPDETPENITLKQYVLIPDGFEMTRTAPKEIPITFTDGKAEITFESMDETLVQGYKLSYSFDNGSYTYDYFFVLTEQLFFSDPTLDESVTIINSEGKLLFSIISATPEVEYVTAGDPDNPVKLKTHNSDGDAFFSELFRLLNGKDAINDVYKDYTDYRIRVSHEGASYHYEFALCSESGSVAVTNNGELIGSVLLYAEETSKLLDLLDEYRAEAAGSQDFVSVSFEAQYIRTDGYRDGVEYPIITVISSKAELDRYFYDHENLYDFLHKDNTYSDASVGFADAIKKYDNTYFETNVLVLILLEEGSGSIRHEVRRVYSGGDIELSIITPECVTEDMAEWHIILEIRKSDAADEYEITGNNSLYWFDIDGQVKPTMRGLNYVEQYDDSIGQLISGDGSGLSYELLQMENPPRISVKAGSGYRITFINKSGHEDGRLELWNSDGNTLDYGQDIYEYLDKNPGKYFLTKEIFEYGRTIGDIQETGCFTEGIAFEVIP